MGILATLKIRNKRNGKTRIVNEEDWANDLGVSRYAGWERVGGETHDAEIEDPVEAAAKQALADKRAEEEAARAEATEAETATTDEAVEVSTADAEAETEAEDSDAPTEAAGESAGEEDSMTEESETLFGEGVARDIKLD